MKRIKNIDFELLIIVFLFLYIGIVYFSIALSNIFLGIAVFLFLWGGIGQRIQFNYNKLNIVLFLILILPFILTLFSVFNSEDMAKAMKSIQLRIPILIVSFILIFMRLKDQNIRTGLLFFTTLTVAATIFTLFKAATYINEGILLQSDFTYFITPIQHPYFGVFLLIALVSVIEFKLFSNKIINLLILSLLFIGIIISTSRLAYILFVLIISFYSIQFFTNKKALFIILLMVILSSPFIGGNRSIQSKFKTSLSYQNSPRLKLWNNAIMVVNNSENKLFGIGVGDYYKVKKDPYFFKESKDGVYGYDPHSQILDFFITNGYLGLLILIGYFIIQVVRISKQNRFAILIFIIISLFASIESILNRQYGVQLYSIFLPLIFKDNFKLLR